MFGCQHFGLHLYWQRMGYILPVAALHHKFLYRNNVIAIVRQAVGKADVGGPEPPPGGGAAVQSPEGGDPTAALRGTAGAMGADGVLLRP